MPCDCLPWPRGNWMTSIQTLLFHSPCSAIECRAVSHLVCKDTDNELYRLYIFTLYIHCQLAFSTFFCCNVKCQHQDWAGRQFDKSVSTAFGDVNLRGELKRLVGEIVLSVPAIVCLCYFAWKCMTWMRQPPKPVKNLHRRSRAHCL